MAIGINSFDDFLINKEPSINRGREVVGTAWQFQPDQKSEFQRLLSVIGKRYSFEVTNMGTTTIVYISTKLQYAR